MTAHSAERTVLVTGGAGFIGSALIRMLARDTTWRIVNVDCLTYAGNTDSLPHDLSADRYVFSRTDIRDSAAIRSLLDEHQPDAIFHLAAESHVDRSIDAPGIFVETNVVGTYTMLQESLRYWRAKSSLARHAFRFMHISTDEVFGSLGPTGYFTETTPYSPRSPYSASKAGSDHLVRAWHHTYELPVIITNCSNNYGPFQFPEKLIPLMILNAVEGKPLPVYGRGENVRDWLFVDDHCRALLRALESGVPGETYVIGGRNEQRNIDVVQMICDLVDERAPALATGPRRSLIQFVQDRPGHDARYAIDASRIERELGWKPAESFESGLRRTVDWYLANNAWVRRVRSGEYRGERLGLGATT